jgi:L-lactate dehydrogenase complex protein LldG
MTDPANARTRSLILGRVRDALGRRAAPPDEEYAQLARDYVQRSSLDVDARVELFADRLQHYQVGVYRCERATLRRTIAETAANRAKSRLLIPQDVPRDWLPADLEAIEDQGLPYTDLDRGEGVLTGCSLAIARTGTIILQHRHADGRRALTLVPDYHLCVVWQEQIVETVPEAISQLIASKPALVTTISGPSATADIEMTRIRGVHGPRTLDVIVAG